MTTTLPATRSRRGRFRRSGIGLRLLAAQGIVLAAGAATTSIVAGVVGPPLFREHLHRAGVAADSVEQFHAEEAYGYATAISLGGAVAVAALAALAVSWYASRRLQRSITEVATAATAVADGHYDTRVSSPRLGDEFDALVIAFNEMASRLQSVELTRRQLFGDLAHEIRTPIAVLVAYIEALEDGVRALTPQTATMLRDQAGRLVRFSDDLASLAKAEESSVSMTYSFIDVERLARRCAAVVKDRYDAKKVALHVQVAHGLPRLWGDEQRLSQVVSNLLDNALRHTPSEGSVKINCFREADRLAIAVIDSGQGITAEHLPRLFERFYRADAARDREHGGAGIGLAIAKALVEAHGGTISVTSGGPSTGAAFTVALPIARPRENAAPVATTSTADAD